MQSKSYHYSKKGKEVQHYELVQKIVIFSPHSAPLTKQLLQSFIPVLGIIGLAWFFLTRPFLPRTEFLATEASVQSYSNDMRIASDDITIETTSQIVQHDPLLQFIAFSVGLIVCTVLIVLTKRKF